MMKKTGKTRGETGKRKEGKREGDEEREMGMPGVGNPVGTAVGDDVGPTHGMHELLELGLTHIPNGRK